VIIVGFLAKIPMKAVAVAFIMAWQSAAVKDLAGAKAVPRLRQRGRPGWRPSAENCTGASPGAPMRCRS
jgi:hypothetical protein